MTKTAARLKAEELCAKFPEQSSLGLARRLKNEHPKSFSSIDSARSMIRSLRGNIGEAKRERAKFRKEPGKAGQLQKCPPSLAEKWDSVYLGSGIKVGIISDTHIPYHDQSAVETAVKDLKRRKLDVLLINGDFSDFYQVSRWQKDPHHRKFSEELKLVKEALGWLRKEFGKKCRIVYKMGNHEERWDHFIWNRAPEIYDIQNIQISGLLELDKYGIELVDNQRIIYAGKLPILHGHELGNSIFSPVNPARGAYLRTHHTVLVGHSHQTSEHADPNMMQEVHNVWSTGCLCNLRPGYRRINRWNHGHAFVDVAQDGNFRVENKKIIEGKVY